MSCDRAEELARLEWMDEAEVAASEQHARACEHCARQRALLFGAGSLLRASQRELSPEGRVALRAAIDQRIEARGRRWMWLLAPAAALVIAALWWPRPSVQVEAPVVVAKSPSQMSLRQGSTVPIAGGQLVIEADAAVALSLEGDATTALLTSGALRVDSGAKVFVVETPHVLVRAADASLLVVADREATNVAVDRGFAEVLSKDTRTTSRIGTGQKTRVPPAPEVAVVVAPEVVREVVVPQLRLKRQPRLPRRIVEPAPVVVREEAPEVVPEPEQTPEIEVAEVVRPKVAEQPRIIEPSPPSAHELMARADRLRRAGEHREAAALYKQVEASRGVLADEASLLAADSLFAADDAKSALAQLNNHRGSTRLSPERAALEARILVDLARTPEAADVLEAQTKLTPELRNTRLLVAKALLDSEPARARELIEPLMQSSAAIRIRALRIALLAAHAEKNAKQEEALRRELAELEEKNE